MIFALLYDLVKLALIVAGLYFAFGAYARQRPSPWTHALGRRHLAILATLVLVVSAIKVSEDVIAGESGPIDRAILVFVHDLVPVEFNAFFELVTWTGSATALSVLTTLACAALLLAGRRFEALLLAGSGVSSGLVIYALKAAVGRSRPDLWDSAWYWGSSFPSGHTLAVAAFSTAAVLGVVRTRPQARAVALALAILWIVLVALSRLVLGVHWPTDVLAAACIGALLPLALSLGLEFRAA